MGRKSLDEQIQDLIKEIDEKQAKLVELKKKKQQEEESRLNESGIRIAKMMKSRGIVSDKEIEELLKELAAKKATGESGKSEPVVAEGDSGENK